MSNRTEIEQAVRLYFDAINQNDATIIPLTDDVVMSGPMMPEQISGQAAVRRYIDEISPFIARITPETTVIDNDSAAITATIEMLNGVSVEGAYFFRLKDGLICHEQTFFDTRILFKGAN